MLLCMRTTIDIQDELLRRAKRKAADDQTSLREIVETALRSYLSRRKPGSGEYRLRWRTERGRIRPGVRLDDRDVLFDIMENR